MKNLNSWTKAISPHKLLIIILISLSANRISGQATATISPLDQYLIAGNSASFTATATGGLGDVNADKKFDWSVAPITGVPVPTASTTITSGTTNTQSFTFNTAGLFVVSVTITKINGGGPGNVGDNVTVTATVTVVPTANSPMNCSGKYFVSHGSAGGATDPTTLNNLSFSGNTIIANTFPATYSGGNIGFNAIGLSPDDGYMYGVRYPTGGNISLVKVGVGGTNITVPGIITYYTNPPTNTTTSAINTNVFAGCFSAAGTYFFIDDNNRFYKLSKAQLNGSRIASYIGATGLLNGTGVNAPPSGSSGIIDIAISPIDGKMYGVSLGSNPSTDMDYRIYLIDTTTGALTRKGAATGTTGQYPHPSSAYIASTFFTEDGTLFGFRSDGVFLKIDLTNPQNSTTSGTGPSYTYADGCNCSFRVGHILSRTSFCPTVANPRPTFKVKVVITNSSGAARSGLTYSFPIGGPLIDPAKRFRFRSLVPASLADSLLLNNIKQNIKDSLVAHGYLAAAEPLASIALTANGTGTNYNTLVVSNFKIPFTAGGVNKDSFQLGVQYYTSGGIFAPVSFQSTITGLPAALGGSDISGNGLLPNAPLVINFQDCGNIILPVKLLTFSGSYRNNNTLLNWVAENQADLSYYEIERSTDGVNFISLNSKQAEGGNARQQYYYNDDLSSVNGTVFYYRLRMADMDGHYTYSMVIMIRRDQLSINGLSIVPNPVVSNGSVNVRLTAQAPGMIALRLIDMTGRVILTQQNNITEGINSISINHIELLQSGTYMVQVINNDVILSSKLSIVR